jgi:hypothetical protein
MHVRWAITLVLAGTVSACSNSQKNPEFEEYLATHIRNDGSKEFYYTVTLTKSEDSKRRRGNKNVGGGVRVSGGSSSNTRANAGVTVGGSANGRPGGHAAQGSLRGSEKMTGQLDKKLLASGYCRDGWMETERQVQHPYGSIRGECNETASDTDRENFPNTEDTSS